MRWLFAAVVAGFALLGSAAAQPPPDPGGLIIPGGYWAGGGCNLVTVSGPTGPRAVMVDAHGNLCVALAASGSSGSGGGTLTSITNPAATLTRPANTTAYAQNTLIASSTTAGSVVVPSFAIANAAGGAAIPRLRLATNKTSGWDGAIIRVRLWTVAPTYSAGDGVAYAVATGAASLAGQYDVTLAQYGDGASGMAASNAGTATWLKLAAGTAVYWDLQNIGASVTPASGQTFTLTAELLN